MFFHLDMKYKKTVILYFDFYDFFYYFDLCKYIITVTNNKIYPETVSRSYHFKISISNFCFDFKFQLLTIESYAMAEHRSGQRHT